MTRNGTAFPESGSVNRQCGDYKVVNIWTRPGGDEVASAHQIAGGRILFTRRQQPTILAGTIELCLVAELSIFNTSP